ncbi:serine/threonine-protein kinase [Paraherbaspirillum soli]|uniref:Serine/threonine-protein kinase PknG n=1 Tax=Paraherbaspirillum soli TaxID=631222 RepID=A0ABW0M9M2_9BURK
MENCQRNACTGHIEDGFCDECGMPPAGVKLLAKEDLHQTAQTRSAGGTGTFATGTVGTVGTGRAGSKRHTSRSTRGSSARRRSLGGGLISLPPLPSQDPNALIMANPEVPERKRRCPKCDAKVSRVKGFCGECGTEYNFVPSLQAGDVVNGKFEIKGAIAFGGLGWIYLGWDQVLNRWVVMKGLLNTKDEAAAANAVAERQFLAAVKHPKIVGIYDFVNHGNEGFIVMEYVGGVAISSMLKQKGVFPVEEAIAYILGILPAFSYLHANGFVYCDFKPDNFMLEGDDVKLIDMGGVRQIGDPNGDIYGTRGYMAPEANDDPVAVSDLYTIGRALAVMIMDFKFAKDYEHSLPTPAEQPLLAQHDALYRFLLRATHQDPDQRFQSADEMADQILGVLREIVSLKTEPKPVESQTFTSDNLFDADDVAGTEQPDVRLLPTLKMQVADPAANELLRLSAVIDPVKRVLTLEQLAKKFGDKSVEARLRLANAYVGVERYADAAKLLDQLFDEDPFDWRVCWYRGKSLLAQGDGQGARNEFGKVYFEMPGEIAPKQAIAFAAEVSHDYKEAASYYRRVIKVDPNQTAACFGLARCLSKNNDMQGAAEALAAVPAQHSLFNLARIALAKTLLHQEPGMNREGLEQVAQTIESISAEGGVVHQLAAKLLERGLALIANGKVKEDRSCKLLGHALSVQTLRQGAEEEFRKAARYAVDAAEKIMWIDMANAVRPKSFV